MSRKIITFDSNQKAGFGFENQSVVRLAAGGQAEAKGVQIGWKVIDINGTKVTTTKTVQTAMRTAKSQPITYAITFMPMMSAKELTKKVADLSLKSNTGAKAVSRPARASPGTKKMAKTPRGDDAEKGEGDVTLTDAKKTDASVDKAVEEKAKEDEAADIKAKQEEADKETAEAELKAQQEEEQKRTKEEVERKTKEEKEVTRKAKEAARQARVTGEITVKYEMYTESFQIKEGSISAEEIDDRLALSFVMPKCKIHLCGISPQERLEGEDEPGYDPRPFVWEEPEGVYQGLETGNTYWVFVNQDEEEERKDRERMRKRRDFEKSNDPRAGLKPMDDGRGLSENCSCIYGNPCVDEYGCRDWYNRWEVAKKNGWKGF